jgi:hypothetical protein
MRSGLFVVMSTDWPRTFPKPSSSGVKLCAPTQEPYPGGVLRGYGYRQPERHDIQGHRFTMAVALP